MEIPSDHTPPEMKKRKRTCYNFDLKDKVYKSVKVDGLSFSHAGKINGNISKSTVRNIVKEGPYDDVLT
jgi:hypothetical protein